MIEARGLTKVYGEKTAVAGVNFTVEAGRVTGFLGPNGAGKSTTMRMIMGLDRPTSGTVTVNGAPFARHARAAARRRRAAGRQGGPHQPLRLQPPPGHGRHAQHPQEARARSHRDDRPGRRGQEEGRRLLARHGAAARHRRGAAGRPADRHPGRAGQRPGPGRRGLGPQPGQVPGLRGPHGLPVQPPDERDGRHRGPPDCDRPRQDHRRCPDPGHHHRQGPDPHPRPHRPAGPADAACSPATAFPWSCRTTNCSRSPAWIRARSPARPWTATSWSTNSPRCRPASRRPTWN